MNITSAIPTAEQLIVRQFRDTDSEALCDLVIANQEHLARYLPGLTLIPLHPQSFKKYIAGHNENDNYLLNAGIWKVSGQEEQLVGQVAISWLSLVPEITYWISRQNTGRGIGKTVVAEVCAWFDACNFSKSLDAIVDITNHPSQRVAKKCGFREIDIRHSTVGKELIMRRASPD